MRRYKITAFVGFETHTKIIEAKNTCEARQHALDYGHKMSNYGNGGFLRSVIVKEIKNKKNN